MTLLLAALACVAGGLLAGLSLDRSVVALPAWRLVGVEAWATFSRHADLGRGLVLYPLLGLSAPLLTLATAVSFALSNASSSAALPVYLAVVLSVGHVGATARAAPNMARVRQTDEPGELRNAFARFERWQAIRAVLQLAAFGANVWALVSLARP